MLSNDLPLDSEGFIDLDQIDDLPDPNLGPPPLLGFDHLYDLGWFDQLIDGTTGPGQDHESDQRREDGSPDGRR